MTERVNAGPLCRLLHDTRGQATVEAAFLIPILLLVLGLMLQPALLFYNRCVMNAAAAETCRMCATTLADDATIRAFALRRLSAIPHAGVFHNGGDAGWEIECSTTQAGAAEVTITNHATPLPLFGIAAGLAASIDSDGAIVQESTASAGIWPDWVSESPSEITGRWG